jgi:hypothetical protein
MEEEELADNIIKLRTKAQERIYNQYPPLESNKIPISYEIRQMENPIERIGKYHVILWYRLLKSIYQDAQEFKCELLTEHQEGTPPETAVLRRTHNLSEWNVLNTTSENISKIQQGKIWLSDWKYYFSLPTGGIVSIGTQNRCTSIQVALVLCESKPNPEDNQEVDKFISLLLDAIRNKIN